MTLPPDGTVVDVVVVGAAVVLVVVVGAAVVVVVVVDGAVVVVVVVGGAVVVVVVVGGAVVVVVVVGAAVVVVVVVGGAVVVVVVVGGAVVVVVVVVGGAVVVVVVGPAKELLANPPASNRVVAERRTLRLTECPPENSRAIACADYRASGPWPIPTRRRSVDVRSKRRARFLQRAVGVGGLRNPTALRVGRRVRARRVGFR
jgi:hypothetical protein